MCRTEAAARPLEWAIKDSLIRYVREMSDGSVRVAGSATETPAGFVFAPDPDPGPEPFPDPAQQPAGPLASAPAPVRAPRLAPAPAPAPASASAPAPAPAPASAPRRFAGTVTLTGHGSLLRIEISDPWLEPVAAADGPWRLTIRDPFEPGARMEFASIERIEFGAGGSLACVDTRLTADGSDLFFAGPYTPGTELDNPTVPEDRP